MEKKHTLLLYEKEIFLNSILQEQFLYSEDYQLFIAQNEKKLLEMIYLCSQEMYCLMNQKHNFLE